MHVLLLGLTSSDLSGACSVTSFRPNLSNHVLLHTLCCMLSRFSRVQLFATPWTAAHQAPLSMGFSRQEYWSGLPCPPPGGLPDPGIESSSLMSPALARGFFTTSATWEAQLHTLSRSKTVASKPLHTLLHYSSACGISSIHCTICSIQCKHETCCRLLWGGKGTFSVLSPRTSPKSSPASPSETSAKISVQNVSHAGKGLAHNPKINTPTSRHTDKILFL